MFDPLRAHFISVAIATVEVTPYDFRLIETLGSVVTAALPGVADRGGGAIRYDPERPAVGTAADFAAVQADPAPAGTADGQQHFTSTAVDISRSRPRRS